MFFFTKGSLRDLQQDCSSHFEAASQSDNSQQFRQTGESNNAQTPPIFLTSKPIIWKVTGMSRTTENTVSLLVFDGDENACVYLDSCLMQMTNGDNEHMHETIREGSVILVKSYSKLRVQATGDAREPKLILTKLFVIGQENTSVLPVDKVITNNHEQSIESRNDHETDEKMTTLTISKLKPSLKNTTWSVLAQLQEVTPFREFVNRSTGFKGKLARLLLQDHSGFVEGVVFNDMIERHNINLLSPGASYLISDGLIKYSSQKMKAWPGQVSSDFELIFTDTTTIKQVDDEAVLKSFVSRLPKRKQQEQQQEENEDDKHPLHHKQNKTIISHSEVKEKRQKTAHSLPIVTKLHKSFETLDQVFFKSKGFFTSCIAVICKVGELKSIQKSKMQKPLSLRNIIITDKTFQQITVAVWGKQAEEFEMAVGSVIMLKDCLVTNYEGLSLSVLMKTVMLEMFASNNISYVSELLDWWDEQTTSP